MCQHARLDLHVLLSMLLNGQELSIEIIHSCHDLPSGWIELLLLVVGGMVQQVFAESYGVETYNAL